MLSYLDISWWCWRNLPEILVTQLDPGGSGIQGCWFLLDAPVDIWLFLHNLTISPSATISLSRPFHQLTCPPAYPFLLRSFPWLREARGVVWSGSWYTPGKPPHHVRRPNWEMNYEEKRKTPGNPYLTDRRKMGEEDAGKYFMRSGSSNL